jgi:hypothetical protein
MAVGDDGRHGDGGTRAPAGHRAAPEDRSGLDERLPCGASLAQLWDTGAAAPGHADCPHCAAALADLSALDRAVREAALSERSAGESGPVDGLAARVMAVVRTELRPGRAVPLGLPPVPRAEAAEDAGDAHDTADAEPAAEAAEADEADGADGLAADWITESAVARVLRAAAATVPTVVAGSCRVLPVEIPPEGLGHRLPRGPLRVRVEIAVGAHRPLHRTAEAVRSAVAASARDALGLAVREIDVAVVDLLDEAYESGDGAGVGAR